ncbi:MAG: type VI secretion system tip protein VgrG [Gammaproteobacteria bacterium]|nr:MAG: type VI secretion system tip protein VgrG [Gammaproteobacteria bacterium]
MPAQESLVAISTPLGDDELLLRKAEIYEELGKPFLINVELVSENEDIFLDDLLGKNVTIRIETQEESRFFNGIVTEFYQKENIDKNSCYGAVIRPWLWLLTLNENCRIFQETSYPDIIKLVFDELGFSDYEIKLTSTYNPQEYVVQYNESDFNFVARIMEQEGIYYYFTHSNGKHILVMADDSSVLPDCGEVPYFDREDSSYHVELEGLTVWQDFRKLRSCGMSLTDFDFTMPSKNLEAVTNDPKTFSISALKRFSYPGKYSERKKGTDYTKILMEKENVIYDTKICEGNYRPLFSGGKFDLIDHPREDQNEKYLITIFTCSIKSDQFISSSSSKEESELFTCKCTVIPANVVYRPQVSALKPKMTGPQTAMVVGKAGEEIWTDKYGRVKVLFHWDRDGEADEKSSCWIRVSQTWAGKNWGTMQIPRIGQEVLIDFLNGDPDKPIIIGSVYNGSTMPPYTLPANATMSGTKSRSSKGGGGFNEFRMEDKKGEEQIFIHGEKNQDINIKNDCFETIGNDRHLTIKNDQIELVENNRNEEVKADHKEKIGKDRHLTIAGKEAKKVEKTLSLKVTGDVAEVFKANHSMKVTKDSYIKGTNICIEATDNITLKVGGSSIVIEKSGIQISTSGEVKIEAGSNFEAKAKTNAKIEAGAMGEFKASAIMTIKGSMVKIN